MDKKKDNNVVYIQSEHLYIPSINSFWNTII